MTAGTPAGAVAHREVDWRAMDWRAVHCEVRRLQARIVKAMQETLQSRVSKGAFERLELHKAKVLRAVLRGRGGSNASLLPGNCTVVYRG
jgi:hypothetical protein